MVSPLKDASWLELLEVDSTQLVAARALKGELEGAAPGVVLARHQTSGRGRFDRAWISQPGESLTMSLIFRAYADHPRPWLVGMAVAAAVAAAVHCRLQWPNDLVLDRRKLGGILSEMLPDAQGRKVPVVGVGLNLNQQAFPAEIADRAISLAQHRAAKYDAKQIAQQIVERIELLPEPDSWASLRSIWALFDMTPGKEYRLANGDKAIAMGIGPDAELLAAVDGETTTVLAADAIFGPSP